MSSEELDEEKIVVNLKRPVSTRAALSGNRKQFNIRFYEMYDGRSPTIHKDTYFFRPHWLVIHLTASPFLIKKNVNLKCYIKRLLKEIKIESLFFK